MNLWSDTEASKYTLQHSKKAQSDTRELFVIETQKMVQEVMNKTIPKRKRKARMQRVN